jgi:hypothetical protein
MRVCIYERECVWDGGRVRWVYVVLSWFNHVVVEVR